MTRKPAVSKLTPSQAEYVLTQAVADRKLSYNDIVSYLGRIDRDIRDLEGRLENLRAVAGASTTRTAARRSGRKAGERGPVQPLKKKPISAKHRVSMKLQGQYLGLLKQMPEARKAEIKKLTKGKGREAAIAAMKKGGGRASKG